MGIPPCHLDKSLCLCYLKEKSPCERSKAVKVGILIKPGIKEGKQLAQKLERWLKARGAKAYSTEMDMRKGKTLPRGLDLLIVLGGDGTMLYAASLVGQSGVPVLGVNLGGLGFLTEVKKTELFPLLKKFLAGKVHLEERMMLKASVDTGRTKRGFFALNEFTIAKKTLSRMIELETRVDGIYLASFRADGLIVSTPTGSTAYCMAAGGPIVHPSMQCLVLIPICAHTLTSRPLVVPASSAVEVRLRIPGTEAHLTVDGRNGMKLKRDQRLVIKAAEEGLALINSPSMDYYAILHTKLHWGDR